MPALLSPARRRAVFWVAASGYVLSQFYRSFLTVIVEDLGRDLGVGPAAFGALGAAWFLAFALAQFPVGYALDRWGPRRTIGVTMGLAVAGALIFASATQVPVALLAMALIGIGCSPLLMGALYFFARTEPPARFAALGSAFLGIGLLGSLLAASPLAHLVASFGWRDALRIGALATLLSAALITVVMRDPPAEASPATAGAFAGIREFLVDRRLWPVLLMSLVISAPVFTERALWIGPFLLEVHGLGALARGDAILAFSVAMALSSLLAGPAIRLVGTPRDVVAGANVVLGLSFLALGFFPAAPLTVALVLLALAGLTGVTYAALIAHARMFLPAHAIGRGITFVNFVSIGGTGLAQLASGFAVAGMREAGLPAVATFGWLHATFGAMALLAALIYWRAPARP